MTAASPRPPRRRGQTRTRLLELAPAEDPTPRPQRRAPLSGRAPRRGDPRAPPAPPPPPSPPAIGRSPKSPRRSGQRFRRPRGRRTSSAPPASSRPSAPARPRAPPPPDLADLFPIGGCQLAKHLEQLRRHLAAIRGVPLVADLPETSPAPAARTGAWTPGGDGLRGTERAAHLIPAAAVVVLVAHLLTPPPPPPRLLRIVVSARTPAQPALPARNAVRPQWPEAVVARTAPHRDLPRGFDSPPSRNLPRMNPIQNFQSSIDVVIVTTIGHVQGTHSYLVRWRG